MTAEQFALWVVGLIDVWLTQFIKERLSLEGRNALWCFFGVSVAISILALVLTGELAAIVDLGDPLATVEAILAAVAKVVALATLVYKGFLEPKWKTG